MKIFGKISLEIDKMAGLQLRGDGNCILPVRSWDCEEIGQISAALTDLQEAVVWEGLILSRNDISEIFKPHDEAGGPRTYATRSGRLGKPKTVGAIRLTSVDAQSFDLQMCNGGGELKKVFCTLPFPPQIRIQLNNGRASISSLLFDQRLHSSRLERLK